MPLLSDAELLARLVAFDTVSRNSNLPLADYLADYLGSAVPPGSRSAPYLRIDRLPSPDGEKANLLVRVGPETDPAGRAGLVLSGHMDVVPADDLDRWESDPFELVDRGEAWVGRGAADMKGFVALAANLAAELVASGRAGGLGAPLVLVLTYDEELGCLGAEHLVRTWDAAWDERGEGAPALPRAAVIGEPTRLRVVRVHKGHLKLSVTYRGTSAHSGYPHLGTNAIERAAEGIAALAGLRRELEKERPESAGLFPEVPYPALNVGTIRGGVAVNVVPDRCSFDVGLRLLPGMTAEPLIERVRAAVAPAAAAEGHEVQVHSASPPMATAPDAPIVRFLLDLVDQDEGEAVSYATDAGWLQRLGARDGGGRAETAEGTPPAGLDCAIFGPGSIEVAHKPNESLPKEDLLRARELVGRAVERFCGGSGGAASGAGAPPGGGAR